MLKSIHCICGTEFAVAGMPDGGAPFSYDDYAYAVTPDSITRISVVGFYGDVCYRCCGYLRAFMNESAVCTKHRREEWRVPISQESSRITIRLSRPA